MAEDTVSLESKSKLLGFDRFKIIILILFFLSGASGLIYEVVWARMLSLIFGATVFATSAVLAAFMGGLALGSYLFGRVIDRRGEPLKVYAYLEIGIGIFALLTPLIFSGSEWVYVNLSRRLNLSFYPLSLIRFFLSFVVLLIPTTMMGGTLPVIGKLFIKRKGGAGRQMGLIYAVNTAGAVVGTFSAGYILIASIGMRETLYLASFINLSVGVGALILNRAGG